jgi:phage terminase large subunit
MENFPMTIRLAVPPKLRPVFDPRGRVDVRGAKGGRGSGKTRTFAMMAALKAAQWAGSGESGMVLCGRQYMNSLAESSLEEIKAAVRETDWLNPLFDIGEKYIRTASHLPGRIDFSFTGLDRNIDSVKSKARIKLAWVDEAEAVAEVAWSKLIPTIREADSELWVTWNPEKDHSATHKRFGMSEDPMMRIATMNWADNPWFPEVMNRKRLKDMRERPDTYHHIWEGDFRTISDAQVLKGRYVSEAFEPQAHWNGPYYGADWGFSVDPTTLVKCWVHDRTLYLESEAYGHQVKIDDTPKLFDTIAGANAHVIRADSARPETINYMQRHGYPRCVSAEKWPGSVEDGVEHLRSYERIVIHTQCPQAFREAANWSYKTDRLTGDVLPVLLSGNDHTWDAVRYAVGPLIARKTATHTRPLFHMSR